MTLDSCIQAKDYERAAELKTELRQLQTSWETFQKQSNFIALDCTHEVEQKVNALAKGNGSAVHNLSTLGVGERSFGGRVV